MPDSCTDNSGQQPPCCLIDGAGANEGGCSCKEVILEWTYHTLKKRRHMDFKPKTEAELAAYKVWKKGEYDFEIIEAVEKIASTGKTMIEMKVKVRDGDGGEKVVVDRLLAETPLKLLHAAQVCGLHDKYLAGSITDADFVGKTGLLILGIEKDRKKQYPDKNIVQDYVVAATGAKKNGGGRDFILSRQI
jgi:hypothetical protein